MREKIIVEDRSNEPKGPKGIIVEDRIGDLEKIYGEIESDIAESLKDEENGEINFQSDEEFIDYLKLRVFGNLDMDDYKADLEWWKNRKPIGDELSLKKRKVSSRALILGEKKDFIAHYFIDEKNRRLYFDKIEFV
ncbi:MAG: hypothetical protein AAB348_02320 [Patescibacteria group bacterium]